MKNRLSSRLRLTLSGVTLLTLLLMCALVFAGMYFQTTADNREQLRQQAAQEQPRRFDVLCAGMAHGTSLPHSIKYA